MTQSRNISNISRKYLFTGLLCNLISYAAFTFLIFIELFNSITTAFIFASTITLPISYFANRIWVFKSSANPIYESMKFFLTYMCAVLAGLTSIQVLGQLFENPYLIQFLTALVIGVATFVIQSLWTFRYRAKT